MLTPGSVLIEKDAQRPRCFQIQDDSLPDAWMSVTHNLTPHELERELSNTGWTFFYMASAIRRRAFGFDRQKMTQAALKRVIANVRQLRCNCLEIDGVATHSFLGIPYVSVSAHPRHIQRDMLFSSL
jgi:hypothetical protein